MILFFPPPDGAAAGSAAAAAAFSSATSSSLMNRHTDLSKLLSNVSANKTSVWSSHGFGMSDGMYESWEFFAAEAGLNNIQNPDRQSHPFDGIFCRADFGLGLDWVGVGL
jgi:hypothetical protein